MSQAWTFATRDAYQLGCYNCLLKKKCSKIYCTIYISMFSLQCNLYCGQLCGILLSFLFLVKNETPNNFLIRGDGDCFGSRTVQMNLYYRGVLASQYKILSGLSLLGR